MENRYDVLVVGGGPAGLAAALTLGRARKKVLICDDEPRRRNVRAEQIHNFVTRDGTPPEEFRQIAREELTEYRNVTFQPTRIDAIEGAQSSFQARLTDGRTLISRRVLLCTGMIDELPEVPGLRELWGRSIFQCPYCHGWEVQGARFAYWARTVETAEFAIFLRGWSDDVLLLTSGQVALPETVQARLADAHVRVDEREIHRLAGDESGLTEVVFADGQRLPRDVLFMHPPQVQVPLVRSLELATDARGFIQVDESRRTSIPGIFAAGDLTTHAQSAISAAAAGMQAAAAINHELTIELVLA